MLVATESTALPLNFPSLNQDPPEPSTLYPALLTELQPQLHEMQFSLIVHVDKVRALETVFLSMKLSNAKLACCTSLWRKGIG